MHVWTRIPEEAEGISGQGFYNDAMVLHDRSVGQLLDTLDELGITDDTIVLYSTDNGPHYNTWPDGAISAPGAARRTPIGKAPTGCHHSLAGRASSRPARS